MEIRARAPGSLASWWSPAVLVAGLAAGWAVAGCDGSEPGVLDAAVDASLDAPPPIEFRSFMMLERWVRADPPAQHTIAAMISFRHDGALPRFVDVDEHSGYHEGSWPAGEPSYGPLRLFAPRIGEATFTVDTGYEPPGGALGWDTGDTLRVTAAGDELPAFDVTDTVPAPAVLTSHDLEHLAAGQLVLDRAAPLALTWQPTTDEVFALFLQFDIAAVPLRGLLCFYPGGSGAASLPVAALGHLLPSTQVSFSNFYFSAASRQHLQLERVKLQMVTWNGRAARILVE